MIVQLHKVDWIDIQHQFYFRARRFFDFVKEHDFTGFSEKELALREKLKYPPFTRIVSIEIESEHEQVGEVFANSIHKALVRILKKTNDIEILGPARASLYQINNRFRRHLILRSYDYRKLHSVLHRLYETPEIKKFSNSKVKLILDIDPVNLMQLKNFRSKN